MALSIGIVGLPNVGKSTLFNALTKKAVAAENYPFCTIEPSLGVVEVPDERLQQLGDFSKSVKVVPTSVEFTDIAGLVRGASEGEGLGNQFLANIRETDAIAEVVRIFDDANVTHVHDKVDPLDDIEIINLELILADRQTVTKRLGAVQKDVKKGLKETIVFCGILERIDKQLDEGKLVSQLEFTDDEKKFVKSLNLLTSKPFMYVCNKKAGMPNLDELNDERWQRLQAFFTETGAIWTIVDAGIEQELSQFEGEEKEMFRGELGASEDGIDGLIKAGYDLLDLITYFTTGETETRAWTVLRDSTAPQAGAAIHSDFEKKFIRADIINWQKLLDAGSYGVAREKGILKTEGKEYVVKDGDVIEFKV